MIGLHTTWMSMNLMGPSREVCAQSMMMMMINKGPIAFEETDDIKESRTLRVVLSIKKKF